MAVYYVINLSISGTQLSPQTVTYASLTDVYSVSLPSTFASAPFIAIASRQQDRGANIVSASKTVTQFQIALSDLMGDGTITIGLFDLIIVGTAT